MSPGSIIQSLQPFVSEHKQAIIDEILAHRTRHIALVFEDIDKPHNISAVLRTSECLGVQDVHFIKNRNDYQFNPDITQGAAKWLSLHHHNTKKGSENISAAFEELRSNGYQILATSLGSGVQPISEVDTQTKTAVVFGTEAIGISDQVREAVDGLVQIPMNGFTESFNLSVSAAIILNTLLSNRDESWSLTEDEKLELKSDWYRAIVREADLILKRALG